LVPKVLPMSPVRTFTYVPGADRRQVQHETDRRRAYLEERGFRVSLWRRENRLWRAVRRRQQRDRWRLRSGMPRGI